MVAQASDGERDGLSNVVSIFPRAAASMPAAIEAAFRRKEGALVEYLRFRIGDAAEAHDIAQAAFLRLWEKRGDLHSDNLEALLFVTARNIANDLLRSRVRRKRWLLSHPDRSEPDGSTLDCPERIAEASQNLAMVGEIIKELPEKCRYAFIRYKFDGQGYDEIAHDLGVSESMVRKHVIRAVSYCAARLSEIEEWK